MDDRTQNMRLGLFVVIGFAILLATLFFLGLSNLFVAKTKLVTTFTESVQGLSVGSAVKYRGVPVGTVSAISLLPSERIVRVEMEIELKNFIAKGSDEFIQQRFKKFLEREIPKGLRCRLEYAGITGMKYIDLDYFVPADTPVEDPPKEVFDGIGNEMFMPSASSPFKDLTGALSVALERLSKIQFEEISGELERSLQSISNLLADPAIRSTLNRINEAAENLEESTAAVNRVLDEKKLNELVSSLEKTLDTLNSFADDTTKEVKDMSLPETAAGLRATLLQLNQTLESVKMLTDYLGTDPQALIKGKSQGESAPER